MSSGSSPAGLALSHQNFSRPPDLLRPKLHSIFSRAVECQCLDVSLQGLEDIIGASIVHSTMQRTRPDDPIDEHIGWVFANTGDPPLSSPAGKPVAGTPGCSQMALHRSLVLQTANIQGIVSILGHH